MQRHNVDEQDLKTIYLYISEIFFHLTSIANSLPGDNGRVDECGKRLLSIKNLLPTVNPILRKTIFICNSSFKSVHCTCPGYSAETKKSSVCIHAISSMGDIICRNDDMKGEAS